MQVNNLYLKNVKTGPPEGPGETTGTARPARSLPATSTDCTDCALSDELLQLVSLARQEPDVRADRVDQAARLLTIDDLSRPEVAVETAEAMLKSDD